MPDTPASRKFIDLILQTSSKWANWDPPIEIKVGDFGTVNRTSGELEVEGNIYDAAFRESLNQQGLVIDLSDPSFQPIKGAIEEDIIMCSIGVRKGDFTLKPEVSASASVKAEFQFQDGKRGAVLVMHKPQQEYIPQGRLLGVIHKANELKDKYIVNSTFTCPGYYLYLSNNVTTGGGASVDWWTDAQAAFSRKAFDRAGQYRYTPLYSLKRRQNWLQRAFRGEEEHLTEEDLWRDCPAGPWDPLDEDGNEDPLIDETDEDFSARQSALEGADGE
ncbi:hypothetical protein DFH29DRAFT_913357 [Suillus ampliporus]|nr:hypothetical protein DFH29DRAFT_913357 [Suillus ampliporus]